MRNYFDLIIKPLWEEMDRLLNIRRIPVKHEGSAYFVKVRTK